jgi:flagellar secretion chaperone FliS
MNSHFSKAASTYRSVSVQTQAVDHDQYQLVVMMFEATLEALARTKGAIIDNNIPVKVAQIDKAIRIVQEGLRTSLDLENGGELASNLANLYDYCIIRMTQANAKNNTDYVDEVIDLVKSVSDAWRQLRQTGPESEVKKAILPEAVNETSKAFNNLHSNLDNKYGGGTTRLLRSAVG